MASFAQGVSCRHAVFSVGGGLGGCAHRRGNKRASVSSSRTVRTHINATPNRQRYVTPVYAADATPVVKKKKEATKVDPNAVLQVPASMIRNFSIMYVLIVFPKSRRLFRAPL